MSEPQFISSFEGINNADLKRANERLKAGKVYKDLSTVCVVPTRGVIPARVVESWMNVQPPMNQKFVRIFVAGQEVGDAYEKAVEMILAHPMLKDFKYLLTLEEDNMPPPDGLLKLYENICDCAKPCDDHFAQVAGLYWTKGDLGQPMIYGNPKEMLAFNPQMVRPNAVQECNGTGMGFTLFHMGLFRDKRLERPWFRTVQGAEGQGTQDLYFMGKIRQLGYRVASDNRVRVGHYDQGADRVW
jgi:hypothetical protein